MTAGSELVRKPLGLVWLSCSNLMTAFGLQKALEPYAYVHCSYDPPQGKSPSLVLCDPGEGEIASEIERLQGLAPGAPVLVFAPSSSLPVARASLRAGAMGIVHGQLTPEQVVRAVSVAAKGEVVLPRDLLKSILEEETPADLSSLSLRQQEILELVSEGLSNHQIAGRLFLSESTIKQHLRHAYKALGARNRTEAARLLRDHS
jgi:DNA-binding NarL/FixJ family response regulator